MFNDLFWGIFKMWFFIYYILIKQRKEIKQKYAMMKDHTNEFQIRFKAMFYVLCYGLIVIFALAACHRFIGALYEIIHKILN